MLRELGNWPINNPTAPGNWFLRVFIKTQSSSKQPVAVFRVKQERNQKAQRKAVIVQVPTGLTFPNLRSELSFFLEGRHGSTYLVDARLIHIYIYTILYYTGYW